MGIIAPLRQQNEQLDRPMPLLAVVKEKTLGEGDFWRSGLLLITSAALGGIAVAIWNRRSLARMRQQGEPHVHEPQVNESHVNETAG